MQQKEKTKDNRHYGQLCKRIFQLIQPRLQADNSTLDSSLFIFQLAPRVFILRFRFYTIAHKGRTMLLQKKFLRCGAFIGICNIRDHLHRFIPKLRLYIKRMYFFNRRSGSARQAQYTVDIIFIAHTRLFTERPRLTQKPAELLHQLTVLCHNRRPDGIRQFEQLRRFFHSNFIQPLLLCLLQQPMEIAPKPLRMHTSGADAVQLTEPMMSVFVNRRVEQFVIDRKIFIVQQNLMRIAFIQPVHFLTRFACKRYRKLKLRRFNLQ